jgi:hypothetical protein
MSRIIWVLLGVAGLAIVLVIAIPGTEFNVADQLKTALADGDFSAEEREKIEQATSKLLRRIKDLEKELRDAQVDENDFRESRLRVEELESKETDLLRQLKEASEVIAKHSSGLANPSIGPADLTELREQAARATKLDEELESLRKEVREKLRPQIVRLNEELAKARRAKVRAELQRDIALGEQLRLEAENERLQRKLRGPSITDMLHEQRTRSNRQPPRSRRPVIHVPSDADLWRSQQKLLQEEQELEQMRQRLHRLRSSSR